MVDLDPVQIAQSQRVLDIIKSHVNFDTGSTKGWLAYPEIPSARDLNPDWTDPEQCREIYHLLPNTWDKPWSDKDTYLETHYRLQREEAITMLRYSIRKFHEEPQMMDDQETCIYTKVFVKGYLMTRLGPLCRVQFSTEKAGKRIGWNQTRRLTSGTLVALSTARDRFRTICLPAIIADHPLRDGLDQNPPTIQLQWANLDDAVLDPTIELVMVESRFGYFEAIRHSMLGLQHAATTATPLDKYLVNADKGDLVARYVQDNPQMDISTLIHHLPNSSSITREDARENMRKVREHLRDQSVLENLDGRLGPYTNLDNSQLNAVHRILTKELAIVQGPPGTGKTFTSVQALEILLRSQAQGSHVIVVAAQTNHAVDQILTQLIQLHYHVVRLGGRTQNEDIKRFSMYNLRRRTRSGTLQADRDFKTCEQARKRNIAAAQRLVDNIFSERTLDIECLLAAGVISEEQAQSLYTADEWVDADADVDENKESTEEFEGLSPWVGDQLRQPPTMDYTDPIFATLENDEMLDADPEDFDLELDDLLADDDDNRGRIDGKWVPIQQYWTGFNPEDLTEHDLVLRRELAKPNLWDIPKSYRGAVYQYWQRELLRRQSKEFRSILADNGRICKNLKISRWFKDTQCIKASQVEIIGCTTTGLCKYRGLLAALQPRTMLIEEAAETREANIMSALYGSLQQLILVGDHQQLAPHSDVPCLREEPYSLRVSMFERLVKLQMPFTVLNMQRRMSPVLREVLNPFYPTLQDHPIVTKQDARPPVPGMPVDSFLFHHTWSEGTDENLSKYNALEADMIIGFIDYLLMNGVPPSQITVLTFYRGQRKKLLQGIKRKIEKLWGTFNNVFTVDSYQGEENDIVILSLVRSGGPYGPHNAGFLRDSNRGVVSISRARRGFFIFGNMLNLSQSGDAWEMWGKVTRVFAGQGRYGKDSRLPTRCQKHGNITYVTHPEEWTGSGGCMELCPDKMGCGHSCNRRCHWTDHERLICQHPCEKILRCGHRCEEVCGLSCTCHCAAFVGAYAQDDSWDDEVFFDTALYATPEDAGGRGRSYKASRGGKSGNRRGDRSGPNNPSIRGHHLPGPQTAQTTSLTQGAYSGQATWNQYDATEHDAQLLVAHRQRSQQAEDLIDFTDKSSPKSDEPFVETFRPVTLNNKGKRNIGDGVVSGSSGNPSPQKSATVAASANSRPSHSQTPPVDLMNLEEVVETKPSESLTRARGSDDRPRVLSDVFTDPNLSEEVVAAITPPRNAKRPVTAATDDLLDLEPIDVPEGQVSSNATTELYDGDISEADTGESIASEMTRNVDQPNGQVLRPESIADTTEASLRFSAGNGFTHNQRSLPRVRVGVQTDEIVLPHRPAVADGQANNDADQTHNNDE